MKHDEAIRITNTALEQLAQALEDGHSETLTKYLATLARFHSYSFNNVLLIACQMPEATEVAGYQTWRKLGRQVRKGEKGIAIVAPVVYKKRDEVNVERVADDGAEDALRGFKVVHVFDVSQTEGKELPQFAEVSGNPGEQLDRLRAFAAGRGITLEYEHIPGGARGLSHDGKITLCPDMLAAEEFSVLAHEIAHELLHKGGRRAETTKAIRETEAEAIAFVVSRAARLECSTHSSDYIQLYRGDKALLTESMEHIQRAAANIIQFLQGAS
jgi:antirestriction protein ArdC